MEPNVRMKMIQTDSDVKIKTLAASFGVSQHSMSNYLNGKRSIPYDILIKFADFFHITTDFLLGLTQDPNRPLPMSAEERNMLKQFRRLTSEQRELISHNIDFMDAQNQRPK